MFILPLGLVSAVILIVLTTIIMGTKVSAKDFFLHLGVMVGLYASAIALGNLLFSVINQAYPAVTASYYYSSPNISLPVATLIIVFPIFLFLSYLLEREYRKEPKKEESWVRRWSVYITLFVSGLILVGDLVAVLYKFLDGQDLTAAFLLKALTVLTITVLVFGYHLQDIRDKITRKSRKNWAIAATLLILVSIVLGFLIIGSPRTQRLLRYDTQKVNDLQNIQWQLINIWQRTGSLPQSLEALNDPISSYKTPVEPQSGAPYGYRKLGDLSFELCADFNLQSRNRQSSRVSIMEGRIGSENWEHEAGRTCFARTIDPSLYPPTPALRQ